MPRGTRAPHMLTALEGITTTRRGFFASLAALGLSACQVENIINLQDPGEGTIFDGCDLNTSFMIVAAARDGIQALDEPRWISLTEDEAPAYLAPDTRVIGLQIFGQTFAIPHNVLWYHEIVNFAPGGPRGPQVAVTYCPLTGSSLVFDRTSIGGTTLGVSGILFMNNLVLFDRSTEESLWPQMWAEARCGTQSGSRLEQHAFVEMEWAEWLHLHPGTRVLDGDQGFDPVTFDYTEHGYPYGTYRESEPFWRAETTMPPLDTRRFSKERVVGLPPTDSDPGIAFPFGALTEREGSFQVAEFSYEGFDALVLWSDEAQGGAAFRPVTEAGDTATLRATASGFEDEETGSGWTVDGRAVSGPMSGARLLPIARTHTAFWGAWAAFHPTTRLWE